MTCVRLQPAERAWGVSISRNVKYRDHTGLSVNSLSHYADLNYSALLRLPEERARAQSVHIRGMDGVRPRAWLVPGRWICIQRGCQGLQAQSCLAGRTWALGVPGACEGSRVHTHSPPQCLGNWQSVSSEPYLLQRAQGQKIQAPPLPSCVPSSRSFRSLSFSFFICKQHSDGAESISILSFKFNDRTDFSVNILSSGL